MKFSEQIQLARSLLRQKKFEDAQNALASITAQTSAEQRHLSHYKAQLNLGYGDFTLALEQLKSTEDNYGSHLSLSVDIACCYYRLGKTLLWQQSVRKIQEDFLKLQHQLSFSTSYYTQLHIAKFTEELGDVSSALNFYENIMNHPEWSELSPEGIVTLSNLLRLSVSYGQEQEIKKYFSLLSQMTVKDITRHQFLELQHSLILAEQMLVGSQKIIHRWQTLLQDSTIPASEKNFIGVDIAEQILILNHGPQPEFEKFFKDLQGHDQYEKFILNLFKKEPHLDSFLAHHFNEWPLSSQLRVLVLLIQRHHQMSTISLQELQKLWNTLLTGLSGPSQKMWQFRLQLALNSLKSISTNRNEIQVNEVAKEISLGSWGQLNLKKKDLSFQLMKLLVEHATLTPEQMIQHLWGQTWTPEAYERLRILVHRLNQDAGKIRPGQKLVTMNMQSIQLVGTSTSKNTNWNSA